ncbi:XdhC family protein [Salinisphaera sp.]|uniref:XdhC family protein n=1 Tax=Salinisphaera sp. TaxID=1914330 RepID=UPI0025F342CD|nr:XdhC family protein [Salinisphaera sp.]
MTDTLISFTDRRRDTQPVSTPRAQWPAWPVYGLVDDLFPVIAGWHAQGRRVALATLVAITGSSPRPLGSEMAINDHGEIAGYVSGGCVEGAVATQALEVLRTGEAVMLDYGAGSPVLDVQLTCGGRIGIFVRALEDQQAYIQRWREARERRQPLDVAIDLDTGTHRAGPPQPVGDERVFQQRYLPPARLVIAGGDPVTLALAQLAPSFGYDVVLLRPYGPPSPPPDAVLTHYDTRPLARSLEALELDAFTALYTLTHDIDDDHAALAKGLASPAFAIGALGSRSKASDRSARLRAAGFSESDLDRLHTPAGLSINAREPREIALSVLAELVALRPRVNAATA